MSMIVNAVAKGSDDITISIDGYVPVDVKIVEPDSDFPVYWRVGDGKKSLLELAVLPKNGFLSSITLVIMDVKSIHKVDNIKVDLPQGETWIPIINLEPWISLDNNKFSQRFIEDFNYEIQVFISEKSMLIQLRKGCNKINWMRCGRNLFLGLDEEMKITHLLLNELTEVDISNFMESVS